MNIINRQELDTLIVWYQMADEIGLKYTLPLELRNESGYETQTNVQELVKQFPHWCSTYRADIEQIEILVLNDKKLESLPDELALCKNLKYLFLEGNNIKDVEKLSQKYSNVNIDINKTLLLKKSFEELTNKICQPSRCEDPVETTPSHDPWKKISIDPGYPKTLTIYPPKETEKSWIIKFLWR